MTQFHLPYHFVAASDKLLDPVTLADFDQRTPLHATHDRFLPMPSSLEAGEGALSGRILCELVNETPMVIGAQQEGESPKRVIPFTLDGKRPEQGGVPAIPGSELRGLLSSVAEAASNSALRVLDNDAFSFRKEMRETPLSAIGMVVVRNGQYWLRPLVMPTIEGHQAQGAWSFTLPNDYQPFFPKANAKVYIGSGQGIRNQNFINTHTSWDPANPVFYGMRLASQNGGLPLTDNPIAIDETWQKVKTIGQGCFLLSRKPTQGGDLRKWENIPESDRRQYVRGILRVLGVTKNRTDIPGGKHHELFIPYPETMEKNFDLPADDPAKIWKEFPISPEAADRYHRLAEERWEATKAEDSSDKILPYRLNGLMGQPNHRLRHGDLVYFRPAPNGKSVAEVAFSSIWRGRIESATAKAITTWDFFAKINPALLPAGAPAKTHFTLAELLFGFVEDRGKEAEKKGMTRALASRVRFWPAPSLPRSDRQSPFEPAITLKILASPKPPSPATYFGPGYMKKSEIGSRFAQRKAKPSGRKFYLHHGADPKPEEWETAAPNEGLSQKMSVTPIRAKTTFYFAIDFTNLTPLELGCLLYALRPADAFRHKIGLGKPLGLGTAKIDVAALSFFDPVKRYREEALDAPLYHYAERAENILPTDENLPAHLLPPIREYLAACASLKPHSVFTIDALRSFFVGKAKAAGLEAILSNLETLGDPAKVTEKVHYPALDGHPTEGKHFEWYVRNDQSKTVNYVVVHPMKEYLRPVANGVIPTLTRHQPFHAANGGGNAGGHQQPLPNTPAPPPPPNQGPPAGWTGPVACTCIGDENGRPKFRMNAAPHLEGLLDKKAAPLATLVGTLQLYYKESAAGCFFRPAP